MRLERHWTEYELAVHSDLPQSTVSTWYRKNQKPSIDSLDKVCKGFGITLSQFFAEDDEAMYLTPQQREMLDNWSALTKEQQNIFMQLFKSIL